MKTAEETLKEYYFNSSEKTQKFISSDQFVQAFIELEEGYQLSEPETKAIQENSIAALVGMIQDTEFNTILEASLTERSTSEIQSILLSIHDSILSNK